MINFGETGTWVRAAYIGASVIFHGACVFILCGGLAPNMKYDDLTRVEFLLTYFQLLGSYMVGVYLDVYKLIYWRKFRKQLNEVRFIIPKRYSRAFKIKCLSSLMAIGAAVVCETLFVGSAGALELCPYCYGMYAVQVTYFEMMSLIEITVSKMSAIGNAIKGGNVPRLLENYVKVYKHHQLINSFYSPVLIATCILFFILLTIQSYYCITSFTQQARLSFVFLISILSQCVSILLISFSGESLKDEEERFKRKLLSYSLSLKQSPGNDSRCEKWAKYQDLIELHLMSGISITLTVSEFVDVDRRLFLGMVGASFTYVIVIIQLKGV